jgi:hypothetical protein
MHMYAYCSVHDASRLLVTTAAIFATMYGLRCDLIAPGSRPLRLRLRINILLPLHTALYTVYDATSTEKGSMIYNPRHSTHFMEFEYSLHYSQQLAIGIYPVTEGVSPK